MNNIINIKGNDDTEYCIIDIICCNLEQIYNLKKLRYKLSQKCLLFS